MNKVLLEHSDIEGSSYDDVIIYGGTSCFLNECVNLNEASDHTKPLKFRGKFQEAEQINKNRRMYPKGILDENVKKLKEALEAGGLCGELDHPTDSIIHFANTSHKITKLWWEANILMGEGVILSTPSGRILRALINDGVRVGISSRGVGNGKVNEDGVLVIGESYKLITFDAVADPSTYQAFQEKVISKNENLSVKIENSRIDTIDKQLLLACLEGIVKKETNVLRENISK